MWHRIKSFFWQLKHSDTIHASFREDAFPGVKTKRSPVRITTKRAVYCSVLMSYSYEPDLTQKRLCQFSQLLHTIFHRERQRHRSLLYAHWILLWCMQLTLNCIRVIQPLKRGILCTFLHLVAMIFRAVIAYSRRKCSTLEAGIIRRKLFQTNIMNWS